jgi:hypothetical protein
VPSPATPRIASFWWELYRKCRSVRRSIAVLPARSIAALHARSIVVLHTRSVAALHARSVAVLQTG